MRGARPERALDAIVRRVLRPDPGRRVLVACSGGPDSVALAALLDRLAREDGYEIVLVHVDHGRRASAAQDECVVLSVAARLGRALRVLRPIVARDDEATMRDARYGALAALAVELGGALVATAHTAEDQAETVLLALFRGTGPEGLAGMPPVRPLAGGVDLIRPVLRATRAQLGAELRRSGLPYALDPSNEDRRYRRNALRPVLAELRRDFPHLDAAIARCAEIVRDELEGNPRAARRRAVRERLRREGELFGVSFADVEAQATAGLRGDVAPRYLPDLGSVGSGRRRRQVPPQRTPAEGDGGGAGNESETMQQTLPQGIDRVLISADELAGAIRRMAGAIARDYAGRSIVLIGVLKGAVFVTADLARSLAEMPGGPTDVQLDFIAVSSYGNAHRSSGEVRLIQDTTHAIEGRHVIIVEDIIDNGHTLHYLRAMLGNRQPASLVAAVLLDKPYHRAIDVAVEYTGLTCPDEFVVGYGLDYQERYRTLPYLAKLRPEVLPT